MLTVGEELLLLYIALPLLIAEFPVKVQLFTVGEDKLLCIPPLELRKMLCPSTVMELLLTLALPPLTVNPSKTVVAASDTETKYYVVGVFGVAGNAEGAAAAGYYVIVVKITAEYGGVGGDVALC